MHPPLPSPIEALVGETFRNARSPMSLLSSLNSLVERLVDQWGYGGIFVAMVLENVIPPIPSELIMPLAGFYVGRGRLEFVPVVPAGLAGTVVGALPWVWSRAACQRTPPRGLAAAPWTLARCEPGRSGQLQSLVSAPWGCRRLLGPFFCPPSAP